MDILVLIAQAMAIQQLTIQLLWYQQVAVDMTLLNTGLQAM